MYADTIHNIEVFNPINKWDSSSCSVEHVEHVDWYMSHVIYWCPVELVEHIN